MQVGKGGLPPAQVSLHSTLMVLQLERGQATLPNLRLSEFDLYLRSLSVAVFNVEL